MKGILVVCFVILKIIFFVKGSPIETETQTSINSTTHVPDSNDEDGEIYDQRQNGTENYRIHVNGVVVLVAPADAVLQAAQLTNLPMESELTGITSGSQVLKPKPRPPSPTDKIPNEETQQASSSSDQTSGKEPNLNILNFLNMFRSLKPSLLEVKQLRKA